MNLANTMDPRTLITAGRVYDISVLLGAESIDYPGDTPYDLELIMTIEKSGICDLSRLVMSAHSGTHLDAPAHFIQGGKTIDQYPITDFIFSTTVVQIKDPSSIQPRELAELNPRPGSALLFKTQNSVSGIAKNAFFTNDYVFMSAEAAGQCLKWKLGLVGIDYITIDDFHDKSFPVHRNLMGAGIFVLEGIDLSGVEPGDYTLLCFPLKIKGGEASPVRAVLVA